MSEQVINNTNTKGQTSPPAARHELKRSQRSEIKANIPFLFRDYEDGWRWHGERANMTALVMPGTEKNSILITIKDEATGEEIELWRTEIRMTGQWQHRLRQFSGEALIFCQKRVSCPKCGASMKVKQRHADGAQFFGCWSYPSCDGLVNIVEYGVE